jgi:hypothetical protein
VVRESLTRNGASVKADRPQKHKGYQSLPRDYYDEPQSLRLLLMMPCNWALPASSARLPFHFSVTSQVRSDSVQPARSRRNNPVNNHAGPEDLRIRGPNTRSKSYASKSWEDKSLRRKGSWEDNAAPKPRSSRSIRMNIRGVSVAFSSVRHSEQGPGPARFFFRQAISPGEPVQHPWQRSINHAAPPILAARPRAAERDRQP